MLPSTGTALVIAPHPDDETIGCGALISRLLEMGVRVRIIVVTDGADATLPPGHTRESFAQLRRQETLQATSKLGLPEVAVVFLPYPDGKAADYQAAIAKDLASHIWLSTPTLILSPYLYDGHPDHRAIASALETLRMEGKIPCPVFEYPIWFWPKGALQHLVRHRNAYESMVFGTQEYIDTKRAALDCYPSQTGGVIYNEDQGFLDPAFVDHFLGPYELFFERIVK